MFQERAEPDPALARAVQEPWAESTKAMAADLRVLQWVEDLEQRVIMADLQQKVSRGGKAGGGARVSQPSRPGLGIVVNVLE